MPPSSVAADRCNTLERAAPPTRRWGAAGSEGVGAASCRRTQAALLLPRRTLAHPVRARPTRVGGLPTPSGCSVRFKRRVVVKEPGMAESTTDHDAIRRWVEERGGRPVSVKGTGGDDAGI